MCKRLFADQSATQARRARAPHHAVCGRPVSYGTALRQREASILRCKAVLRHASRDIQQTADLRVCTHEIATLRSLSLGRRRSTRACGARAPRLAGCGRSIAHERTLHTAGLRVCSYAIAPLRYLSIERRRSTRACSDWRRVATTQTRGCWVRIRKEGNEHDYDSLSKLPPTKACCYYSTEASKLL